MAPFALFLVCFIHWSDAKALPAVSNQSWMMKDKGSLDGLSSLQRNSHTCRRNATCFPANQTTCLGVKLPYQYTSSDIIGLLPHQMFVSAKYFIITFQCSFLYTSATLDGSHHGSIKRKTWIFSEANRMIHRKSTFGDPA